jgi:hypothetical protein
MGLYQTRHIGLFNGGCVDADGHRVMTVVVNPEKAEAPKHQ